MLRQPRPYVPYTFPFSGQSYINRILHTRSANLIALWGLSETSGTNAVNSEGTSARDGTYTNGPVLNSSTFTDGTPAPSFDGTNDVVNVYSASLASAINFDEWTVMGWWLPDATFLASATNGTLVVFTDNFNGGFYLIKGATANSMTFQRRRAGVNTSLTATGISAVWTHFAFSGSVANNEIKAYVNGVLIGTDICSSVTATLASTRACIGAITNAGTVAIKGGIKDVALWTTPLSAADIAALASV